MAEGQAASSIHLVSTEYSLVKARRVSGTIPVTPLLHDRTAREPGELDWESQTRRIQQYIMGL